MRHLLATSLALTVVCLAPRCPAQPLTPWSEARPASPPRGLPPPPTARPVGRIGYGEQTIAVDGIATLVSVGTLLSIAPIRALPLATWGLIVGGPIVHWAHGEAGRGFLALGLNVGGALMGSLAGWGAACLADLCGDSDALVFSVFGGGVVGLLAAVAFDVTTLSQQERQTNAPRARGLRVAPDLHVMAGYTSLGVVGTF